MTFSEEDFRGLGTFAYTWRRVSERYDLLPNEVLRGIRPLTVAGARRLASSRHGRCAEFLIREFDLTIVADENAADSVCAVLEKLPVPPDAEIVVFWSYDDAVVTTWATLARYWSSFLHASSDDVTVWSPGHPWALCDRHFQVIQFRQRVGID
jgi:hypothetical protein